jgi:PAS domain S-box-containing protein
MSISATPTHTQDLIARTRWYVNIRWFLLLAIALPGILSLFIVDGWSMQLRRDIILCIFALCTNAIFYILVRYIKNPRAFYALTVFLVGFDVLLVSILIYINGAIESRNAILYIFPIFISAALLGRRAIYITTGAAIIVYNFIIVGSYLEIIPTVGAFDPTIHRWFGYVVNTVVFFSAVLMIIALVIDFIMRLLAEKELIAAESISALKQAQSIAKFGSWEWDVKNDKVYWSEELCRIFGINSSDGYIDYANYLNAIHIDDREMAIREINKGLIKNKPFSFDHRLIKPDKSVRYLRGYGKPVTDDKGEVIKLIGTAQDITEAKMLEMARSDFVALASHQLRTPATGVKQYLSLLLEGYAGSLSKDQDKFLRIAYESNDRQLSIVDDLLSVVQVDSGNLKLRKSNADLVSFINEIVNSETLAFENKQQTLSFDSAHKKLMCAIDKRRLRMAIENILNNAHKYTPKKGNVSVNVTKHEKYAVVTIADDGPGIGRKDFQTIFKKFTRLNNQSTRLAEGTGLGLYIADRIVKLHGGKIQIVSAANKGAKFVISIPLLPKK